MQLPIPFKYKTYQDPDGQDLVLVLEALFETAPLLEVAAGAAVLAEAETDAAATPFSGTEVLARDEQAAFRLTERDLDFGGNCGGGFFCGTFLPKDSASEGNGGGGGGTHLGEGGRKLFSMGGLLVRFPPPLAVLPPPPPLAFSGYRDGIANCFVLAFQNLWGITHTYCARCCKMRHRTGSSVKLRCQLAKRSNRTILDKG